MLVRSFIANASVIHSHSLGVAFNDRICSQEQAPVGAALAIITYPVSDKSQFDV